MRKLQPPPTLRIPDLNELPDNGETRKALSDLEHANIVEGYSLSQNTETNNFKFYAEINIDNPRIWNLFKAFLVLLPNEVSFIFNYVDEETIHGDYEDKYSILNKIEPFRYELSNDCFIEYGAIYQSEFNLEEIFVDSSKYIKYWGNDLLMFRKLMDQFDLTEVPDLSFYDEFPSIKESLTRFKPDYNGTQFLIQHLKELFCS